MSSATCAFAQARHRIEYFVQVRGPVAAVKQAGGRVYRRVYSLQSSLKVNTVQQKAVSSRVAIAAVLPVLTW
jgi:hypothetical protein